MVINSIIVASCGTLGHVPPRLCQLFILGHFRAAKLLTRFYSVWFSIQ